MANKTIGIVLELPGKGAFAPDKIGSRYGNFMRTRIPGEVNTTHTFGGRIYNPADPKEAAEFNQMCEETIPYCHRRRMRVIPRIVQLPEAKKKKAPAKKGDDQKAAQNQSSGEGKAPVKTPALSSPPGGK
jgi:hypothetical protein